jgi:hypothetical protein
MSIIAVVIIEQAFVITELKSETKEQNELLDFWCEKVDSLLDSNMELSTRYWDLKDSLAVYVK